jgi:hypothetical protein
LSDARSKIENEGRTAKIKAERTRLLKRAQVKSVIELRRRVNRFDASIEQQGILMRLDDLSFLEGSNPKAS